MLRAVIIGCLFQLVLVSSCASPPIEPVKLAEFTNIPITSDHELTMDSATVLVDEKLLVKEKWTDAEKVLLWEILANFTPISVDDGPLIPAGYGLRLTAKHDNHEVVFAFYSHRCRMTVKENAVAEKTQWFTYSDEDYQKLRKFLYY